MKRFRVKARDFTRERVLTWQTGVVLMLRGREVAWQTAVNKFFRAIGAVWRVVTARAYSQARQKVHPEVFVQLKAVACEEYYTRYGADDEVALWHGQRVLGGAGSYLPLPDTEETRRTFRVQTTQHLGGAQGPALASVLYELRTDVGLSAALGPKQAEKNLVFETPVAATQAGDVLVGDRAYADYSVRAQLRAQPRHFVIGLPRQSFTAVNAFWAAPAQEQEVTRAVTSKSRAWVAQQQLPTTVRVWLIKVVLVTGEGEV